MEQIRSRLAKSHRKSFSEEMENICKKYESVPENDKFMSIEDGTIFYMKDKCNNIPDKSNTESIPLLNFEAKPYSEKKSRDEVDLDPLASIFGDDDEPYDTSGLDSETYEDQSDQEDCKQDWENMSVVSVSHIKGIAKICRAISQKNSASFQLPKNVKSESKARNKTLNHNTSYSTNKAHQYKQKSNVEMNDSFWNSPMQDNSFTLPVPSSQRRVLHNTRSQSRQSLRKTNHQKQSSESEQVVENVGRDRSFAANPKFNVPKISFETSFDTDDTQDTLSSDEDPLTIETYSVCGSDHTRTRSSADDSLCLMDHLEQPKRLRPPSRLQSPSITLSSPLRKLQLNSVNNAQNQQQCDINKLDRSTGRTNVKYTKPNLEDMQKAVHKKERKSKNGKKFNDSSSQSCSDSFSVNDKDASKRQNFALCSSEEDLNSRMHQTKLRKNSASRHKKTKNVTPANKNKLGSVDKPVTERTRKTEKQCIPLKTRKIHIRHIDFPTTTDSDSGEEISKQKTCRNKNRKDSEKENIPCDILGDISPVKIRPCTISLKYSRRDKNVTPLKTANLNPLCMQLRSGKKKR